MIARFIDVYIHSSVNVLGREIIVCVQFKLGYKAIRHLRASAGSHIHKMYDYIRLEGMVCIL